LNLASSRAKNATVVWGRHRRERALERLHLLVLPALDAVHDDEPTAIAKVSEQSAAAIDSGVPPSPSNTSTPCAPLSLSASARRRARRSAIRPWSSPWIR